VNLVKLSKVCTCDLGRNPNQNAVQRNEHILHLFAENPSLSVRQISQIFEATTFTVWKNENMHPYHYTRVGTSFTTRKLRSSNKLLSLVAVAG
jgi:hypothetical protein